MHKHIARCRCLLHVQIYTSDFRAGWTPTIKSLLPAALTFNAGKQYRYASDSERMI